MSSSFNYTEPKDRKASLSWWAGEQRWGCTAQVYNGAGSVGFHRCGKKATKDPDPKGNPTKCGIHCNEAILKRREKSKARYEEGVRQRAANRERAARRQDSVKDAIALIEQIAQGHNDPRSACQGWLNRYGEQS